MFKEFKEFISRGNVMDLAVAVIMGGAFGKIVNSLVDNIIMPIIGLLLGKVNFENLKLVLPTSDDGSSPNFVWPYGLFIQNVVNFLIISFSIFIFVRIINKFRKKREPTESKASLEQKLLTEIRDELKNKK